MWCSGCCLSDELTKKDMRSEQLERLNEEINDFLKRILVPHHRTRKLLLGLPSSFVFWYFITNCKWTLKIQQNWKDTGFAYGTCTIRPFFADLLTTTLFSHSFRRDIETAGGLFRSKAFFCTYFHYLLRRHYVIRWWWCRSRPSEVLSEVVWALWMGMDKEIQFTSRRYYVIGWMWCKSRPSEIIYSKSCFGFGHHCSWILQWNRSRIPEDSESNRKLFYESYIIFDREEGMNSDLNRNKNYSK